MEISIRGVSDWFKNYLIFPAMILEVALLVNAMLHSDVVQSLYLVGIIGLSFAVCIVLSLGLMNLLAAQAKLIIFFLTIITYFVTYLGLQFSFEETPIYFLVIVLLSAMVMLVLSGAVWSSVVLGRCYLAGATIHIFSALAYLMFFQ